MNRKIDWSTLIGNTYGDLEIIEILDIPFVRARCRCGKRVRKNGYNLRHGNTRSCGCARKNDVAVDGLTGEQRALLVSLQNRIEKLCYNKISLEGAERHNAYILETLGYVGESDEKEGDFYLTQKGLKYKI